MCRGAGVRNFSFGRRGTYVGTQAWDIGYLRRPVMTSQCDGSIVVAAHGGDEDDEVGRAGVAEHVGYVERGDVAARVGEGRDRVEARALPRRVLRPLGKGAAVIPPNRQARRARGLLPEGANTVARLLPAHSISGFSRLTANDISVWTLSTPSVSNRAIRFG